jgi:YD repeat-containing protein
MSPLGFTAYQTYNASGQLSSKTDFTGVQVTFDYYPNGVAGAGLLKSETGPTGKKTYHSYWRGGCVSTRRCGGAGSANGCGWETNRG